MRSPTEVLKHLNDKARDKTYKFERLYRNLYNPEFYLLAYSNIYANGGSMTPGVDGSNMDGMSQSRIDKLIASLKDQSYQPKPARRTYIAKKGNTSKLRPLGIPSGNDKLVQEVVRMVLESIYEPIFSDRSHGFRPKRGCHTALRQVQATFTGAVWFLEGDITACFDSFNHQVLIKLLRKRIDDERFIALMWKFLKAGYMEQWTHHETYSGTPQGSGMSPILANIYLHELDCYLEGYAERFRVGETCNRKINPKYQRISNSLGYYKAKYALRWTELGKEERARIVKQRKGQKRLLTKTPSRLFCDTDYKRLQYVRYADDWLCGIIGSRKDAERIKEDIAAYLKNELQLTLSEEKTVITHATSRARFLGYDVFTSRGLGVKRMKNGVQRRSFYGRVQLHVPADKIFSKLMEYKAIRVKKDEKGRDHWRAIHRGELINHKDIDILTKYNLEVRGLYNYYRMANNVSGRLGSFSGLMKHSMLRTFAGKYRTTVDEIKKRYTQNGNFTVTDASGKKVRTATFYKGFSRETIPLLGQVDVLPLFKRYDKSNSLAARMKANHCELCGNQSCEVEIHQVKKLKDLKGTSRWEKVMLEKRRKTLAVCHECHVDIHESV